MDNPGISLFQGADLKINNSQNNEEEEDLEDQARRKEELQNLLQANLDDFKYDDSTINSSTNISLASNDHMEKNYKEAISVEEQLRVLYDVRCREIESLKDEYNKFKLEKTKEVDSLKQQNILFEGELRQLKISLANAENLIVEKMDIVKSLSGSLQDKEVQIDNLQKALEENELELATYKSEITQLQIKMQSNNGPFNLNAKFNSEEFQKSLQDKINKLENSFEETRQKLEMANKEKNALQDEVFRLAREKMELEKENQIVLNNFDDAQQQCRNLIDVLGKVKEENNHFKEKIQRIETGRDSLGKSNDLDQATLASHNERLKKMLLDKSVEIDTLRTKLGYYEDDIKELIEYRQLKADVYRKEFQTCDNHTHTKDLLLMQNDLQNYKRIIDEKSQQILNLNATNKDLQEKIQEMLMQTRNEIQNISSKYNMPKLEVMSKDLERAENAVKVLSEKLEESEERRMSLIQKLKTKSEQKDEAVLHEFEKSKQELKEVKLLLENEREQNQILCKDLEHYKKQLFDLKNEIEELNSKHQEIQKPDDNLKTEYEQLKTQLQKIMKHLEQSNSSGKDAVEVVSEMKIQMDDFLNSLQGGNVEKGVLEEKVFMWKKLLDQISLKDADEVLKAQYKEAVTNLHYANEKVKELKNALLVANNEKQTLAAELEAHADKLKDADKKVKQLESEIGRVNAKAKDSRDLLAQGDGHEIDKQHEAKKLRKLIDEMKIEIGRLKSDNLRLHDELNKQSKEEKSKMSANVTESPEFLDCLKDELLKCELKLRDDLQIEYQKRIADIEKRYQKSCKEATELCKQQKEELESRDKKFRDYLKTILNECEAYTKKLEEEKSHLAEQLKLVQDDFEACKKGLVTQEETHKRVLMSHDKEYRSNVSAWKTWSERMIGNCLDVVASNHNVRDKVLKNLQNFDREVAEIEKIFDAKIKEKTGSKKHKG